MEFLEIQDFKSTMDAISYLVTSENTVNILKERIDQIHENMNKCVYNVCYFCFQKETF